MAAGLGGSLAGSGDTLRSRGERRAGRAKLWEKDKARAPW